MRLQFKAAHGEGTIGALPQLVFLLFGALAFHAAALRAQEVLSPAQPMAGNPSDRVVREIERKYGAKLVKNPRETEVKGRKVLIVTLIDDEKGRVFEVRVDAETGKEL
jgi:hypothetical protein